MKPAGFLLLLVLLGTSAHAAMPLDDAVQLYRAKKYPEARAALEQIVAAEPANAAACYYLGMTLRRRADANAFEEAVKWLRQAVELAPENSNYLADYGGTSLQLAEKKRSFSAATAGRDALEKSLQLDPCNLDAREGLMRFYQEAPWPLSSRAKARAQLDAIRQQDFARGTMLMVAAKVAAKDYSVALALCDEVLARQPEHYVALYHYGRIAAIGGLHLERGLVCLQKCLTLDPAMRRPSPSEIWSQIGNVQEKLGQPAAARQAYETALHLDSGNRSAAEALATLK